MNALKTATLLFALLAVSAPVAHAGETYEIDQITDMSASTPEQFYRFEPNYFWIKPGDTVRFLNSVGNHTVKTVRGIWPDGIVEVDIEHEPEYEITLNTPGVYGFKCKVHNRHGMFALIVVGDVEPDFNQWEQARLNDVGKRVFSNIYKVFEQDYAARH
ncbi:plastocyanin/azurin family copper-binding protein [Profundibacter sp.]